MPSATDARWLKTLGRLPWWRTRAYAAKQSGNGHVKELSKGPHSFATAQLDLPNDLQARLRNWVLANVAQEDLSPDEAQDDAFHVTVLYGLKTDRHELVAEAVKGAGPVRIELGAVAQFDKHPDYDVLIVPVVKETGLRVLRKQLTDQLPWEATQDGYAPHVTLAYVRKGAGRRHLGATVFLGMKATVDRLRVSDSKGTTSWVSLLPVTKMKKLNGNGRSYVKPVEPLKKGETLTFNPETGERGVWRNIGGRSVFIAVAKGESVPDAVARTKEGRGKEKQRGSLPTRSPDPASVLGTHPASPIVQVKVGSRDEAERFASESARPGRWFHGASARFGDPAEALRASVPGQTRGAVFGSGVYLTDDAKEATQYGDRVFETRVDIKNPLIYPTEASSFQRLMDQTDPSKRVAVAKQVRGFRDAVRKAAERSGKSNEEVITAIARRSGFDAIEVWHPNRTWLVVPDPSRIMVMEGSRKKSLALVMTPHGYPLPLAREPTRIERKVDFATIVLEGDRLQDQAVARVKAVLTNARDKLLALVERKHRAGELTAKFVLDLELRGLGQLVPTLREALGAFFRFGQRTAEGEVRRGRAGVRLFKGSVDARLKALIAARPDWDRAKLKAALTGNGKAYQVKLVPEGLPPEAALEFFERKAVLLGTEVKGPLLAQTKHVLFNAIKTGQGLRETIAAIQAAFLPWMGDEDQLIDEAAVSPYRIETMIRTSSTEAFTEGRKEQFQAEVDSGFIIGYQFSAIIDDATTAVCRYMDQRVLRTDSQELDQLSPPLHWNCRSLLSPVLRTEGPVEYLTPRQAARGIEMKGKGFGDVRVAKVVEPIVEAIHVEDVKRGPEQPFVVSAPSIRVEGPQVHVPEPRVDVHLPALQPRITVEGARTLVRVEAPIVNVPEPRLPDIRVEPGIVTFDEERLARAMAGAMADALRGGIVVHVAPNILVQAQEPPRVEVTVNPTPVIISPTIQVQVDRGKVKKTIVRETERPYLITEVLEEPVPDEAVVAG